MLKIFLKEEFLNFQTLINDFAIINFLFTFKIGFKNGFVLPSYIVEPKTIYVQFGAI